MKAPLLCALAIATVSAGEPECFCHTRSCPTVGDNTLTVGNGTDAVYHYIENTIGYTIVSAVQVSITAADLDHGSDTSLCTREYSRMLEDDGNENCDAGHILAHRLGGPGNEPTNIFPQDYRINRGDYRMFEADIYDCVAGGASVADLSWKFMYSNSTSTMPSSVDYSAKFKGGSCDSLHQVFSN